MTLFTGIDHVQLAAPPARKAHPALRAHSLDLAHKRLQEFNWPVKSEQPLNGAPRFYTEDSFGNRIELIER